MIDRSAAGGSTPCERAAMSGPPSFAFWGKSAAASTSLEGRARAAGIRYLRAVRKLGQADDDEWTPMRSEVDEAQFQSGRIGPYRLGMHLRSTLLGEVTLAIHDTIEQVVELDIFDALQSAPIAGPEGILMTDLGQVVGLQHPHLATLIGAGLEGGVPYVARRHRLGRTLAELLGVSEALPKEVAAVVLFAVAEATGFLAEQGASPGACSMGGFDARDVFLGYEGGVVIVGTGLKLVRSPDGDAIAADLRGCFEMARLLDGCAGTQLSSAIAGSTRLSEVARAVRRRYQDACARRAQSVGAVLRECFGDALREERAFFGMAPLH